MSLPLIDFLVGSLEVDLPEEESDTKDINQLHFTRIINREFLRNRYKIDFKMSKSRIGGKKYKIEYHSFEDLYHRKYSGQYFFTVWMTLDLNSYDWGLNLSQRELFRQFRFTIYFFPKL